MKHHAAQQLQEKGELPNNIAALSKVYGNMLAAMGVNTNK